MELELKECPECNVFVLEAEIITYKKCEDCFNKNITTTGISRIFYPPSMTYICSERTDRRRRIFVKHND